VEINSSVGIGVNLYLKMIMAGAISPTTNNRIVSWQIITETDYGQNTSYISLQDQVDNVCI